MGTLIPGEALIYERANGIVYARYRDAPHNTIPRWPIGGDPGSTTDNTLQGDWINWHEWQDLCALAEENPTLKKLLDKLITTYYVAKENKCE